MHKAYAILIGFNVFKFYSDSRGVLEFLDFNLGSGLFCEEYENVDNVSGEGDFNFPVINFFFSEKEPS